MKWKTFQRIYRELLAENHPKDRNIIIRYVTQDKIKGSTVCKLKDFKKQSWKIYEKNPIIIVIGLDIKGEQDIRLTFKYIICAYPEEIPPVNDNFCIKCFSLMDKKSKNVIIEILMRQILNYIGEIDADNPKD